VTHFPPAAGKEEEKIIRVNKYDSNAIKQALDDAVIKVRLLVAGLLFDDLTLTLVGCKR